MQRKSLEASMRVDCMISSPVKRGRGSSRRALEEIVWRDLKINNIPENLFFNDIV